MINSIILTRDFISRASGASIPKINRTTEIRNTEIANPDNRNTEIRNTEVIPLIKDKKEENNFNSGIENSPGNFKSTLLPIENSGTFKSTMLFNFQASSTIMPIENKGYSLDDVITAAGGFGKF